MANFMNNIILDILEFIYREGGDPKTWYIGVANDPRKQLFDEHQVHYQNDAWIYRTATSEGEALQVQSYFLEFGLDASEKGWQPGACTVYAYKKQTEPFIKARPKAARTLGIGYRQRVRHT
jgi:hypothetical protein